MFPKKKIDKYIPLLPSMEVDREGVIKESLDILPDIINGLSKELRERYLKQLYKIQRRYYDPEFKLAVIGNFSTGKSTFLNALIGQELLSVSVLPTTAIPTYMRWVEAKALADYGISPQVRKEQKTIIKIVMHDASEYVLVGEGARIFQRDTGISLPVDVGEQLDYVTTTTSLIGKIHRIEVFFPERKGFEKFCLIDTPGINPGDEASRDHIIQTQMVLKDEADAAMVLYTAKDAMTKDTRMFMEDNGAHLMRDAIVVLTKMDLVPEKQKEKVIRSTINRIREQYNQVEPRVYCISAWEALEYICGRSNTSQSKMWAKQFNAAVSSIMNQLRERRNEIVSTRIISLITEMVDILSKIVNREIKELTAKKELLEQASVKNLEADFGKIYAEYKSETDVQSFVRTDKIKEIVHTSIQKKCDKICDKIDKADNRKELNECLDSYFQKKMDGIDQKVIQKVNEQIMDPINELNKVYVHKAESCLEKYNHYLGKIHTRSVSVKSRGISDVSISTASEVPSSFMDEHLSLLTAAGVALFLPGLGLFALAAGFIWDAVRLESAKDDAKKDVRGKLKDYENELVKTCEKNVEQIKKENLDWANHLLSNYKTKYLTSFTEIESAYIQHKKSVEKQLEINRKNSENMLRLRRRLTGMSKQ